MSLHVGVPLFLLLLKDFVSKAENEFSFKGFKVSFKVAAVRSDNDKEFCNNQMKGYCSSAHCSAQRKHRTVQEKARVRPFTAGKLERIKEEIKKIPKGFGSGS